MKTTTTTRRRRGRRVAAAVLVGLGLVSLGVASASQLDVNGTGDVVAAGAEDVKGTPFFGSGAKADVNIIYKNLGAVAATPGVTTPDAASAALATEDSLATWATLTVKPDNDALDTTEIDAVHVYFYADGREVATKTFAGGDIGGITDGKFSVDFNEVAKAGGTPEDVPISTISYDRVAVVAVSKHAGASWVSQ